VSAWTRVFRWCEGRTLDGRIRRVEEPSGIGGSAHVDPPDAVSIGHWYLHARSAHRDGEVIRAYEELQKETDRLFVRLTQTARPTSVRVVFTRCRDPYANDGELIAAVRTGRTLELTSAAVAGRGLHPLLGCDFGGALDRFRAVHDLIGHAWCGYSFELADELAAWRAQQRMHGPRARLALATELLGVNAARFVLGDPPELRALLLGSLPAVQQPPGSGRPGRT